MGEWAQVVKLLRGPWERAIDDLDTPSKDRKPHTPDSSTWEIAQRLMTALLHEGRAKEPDDVLQAFRTRGGKPDHMEALVALAEKTGQGSMAASWKKASSPE